MYTGLGLSVTQAGNSESPLLPPSPSRPSPRPANPSICMTISKIDLPAALFLPPPPPCPRPSRHPLSPQLLQGPHNWSHCPIPILLLQPEPHGCPRNRLKVFIWLYHRHLKCNLNCPASLCTLTQGSHLNLQSRADVPEYLFLPVVRLHMCEFINPTCFPATSSPTEMLLPPRGLP